MAKQWLLRGISGDAVRFFTLSEISRFQRHYGSLPARPSPGARVRGRDSDNQSSADNCERNNSPINC